VKDVIDAKGIEEPRDLFCKFFDYLYKRGDTKVAYHDVGDTPSRKAYNELWNSVYEVKHETAKLSKLSTTITVDEDKVEQLYALKPWNRIVTNTHSQLTFLREVVHKDKLTAVEAKLTLLALEDTGLTLDDDLIKKIKDSGAGVETMEALNRITERTKTVLYSTYKDEQTEGIEPYDLLLRSLFELDFSKTKDILNGWEAEGTNIIKKALVLSFFDKNRAKNLLSDYIKLEPNEKEQYYATRLLNMLEDAFPPVHSLDRYENANVQDYCKDLSGLTKRAIDKKEKIKGYGIGKHEKIIYIGGKPNKISEATAVLNFFLEAPSFVSYRNFYTMMSPEDWYHIHQVIFERYPLPVIYYGLQCTDSKVKTRIGQDYSYSDYLAENCLDDILTYLLKAYIAEDTPNYLRESILIVARELFVSVEPAKWEALFMQIWEDVVLKYRYEDCKNRRFDELDKFVEKGLNSLRAKSLRQRIIHDVLTHVKEDTGFAINCFYYLHTVPGDLKGDNQLTATVERFVNEINNPDELNVAGNIYRLLTSEEKYICAQKCLALLSEETSKITNLVYHVSQFFVKDNPEMRAVFIKSICENPLLWKNGVMGANEYADFTYLKLSEIMRRIYIDQASLVYIFEQLKTKGYELINFCERHNDSPFFSDTDGLLSEMITFLRQYEKRLYKEDGFYEILTRVNEAYHRVSGLNRIEDGLLSEYEEDLNKSLKYITANKDTLTHKELNQFFDIVINRVLMKNSDGLDLCIAYLWYYLKTGLIGIDDERLISGLLRILDRYEKPVIQECNMDLVSTARHLGKMADFLSRKEFKSKGIDYWKHFKKTSRFYSNFD
jgi:hypothetical protein